jgi:hypothetical protein
MRTAPTAAMKVLLGLPPLHLQLEVVAKIRNYRLRCNEQWKPKSEGFGHTYMSQDIEKEPILQIRFPDRSEWKKGFHSLMELSPS